MKQKAFTLFTALVSFILIMLAVLLIQSMIRAERNTTDVISDISEQEEMQAIADLARADAFQVFNFGIRYSIEDWLIKDEDPKDGIPDNLYLLRPELDTWQDIQDDFAKTNFGGSEEGRQFAIRTAKHLSSILARSEDIRGYDVDLDQPDEALLADTLHEMLIESSERGEFFTVIQCPNGEYKDCLGTFYVNLDLADLDEEAYESFPQIRVEHRETGRVLKEPILPRGRLQIYVPIRIFKAIAGAWEIAKTDDGKGLFDNEFRNEIENIRLGLCDSGSCVPRADPETPTHGTLDGYACPGDDLSTGVRLTSQPVNGHNYNPDNPESMNSVLTLLAEERMNDRANLIAARAEVGFDSDPTFELQTAGTNAIRQAVALANSNISKEVESQGHSAGEAFCSEITQIWAKIVFKELNEKYKVINRPPGSDKQNVYGVKIQDTSYSSFGDPVETCETVMTTGTMPSPPEAEKCEPR